MATTALSRLLEDEDQQLVWVPLSRPDYVLLIVAGLHQALVVVAVSHLMWRRTWPPYVVKNVPLVCVTGIAGVINLAGVVLSFGFWNHEGPSLVSNCFFQGVITWTGAGLYYCAAVVRVYRNYKVLIQHNADMLPPVVQILLLQTPIWMLTFALLSSSVTYMDFNSNRCEGSARFVLLAAFNYAGALLVGATYLLWRMKNARRQMNEYRVMMLSLGFLLFTVVLLDASSGGIAADRVLARRIALVNNLVRSALLFWPVIFTPLVKYCIRDVTYAEQFSVGLAPTVTPAILRASLSDQLKVEDLWVPFRKIACEKMPAALPDFFKAVMDRDREEEHFERQAKTMIIIDTYVVESAPSRVDISDACREKILASDVTRYSIFVEAAAEVFLVLREMCEVAFQASPAYEILLLKAQMDEAEMEALEKVKLVPKETKGFRTDRGSNGSRSDRWTNSTITGRLMNPLRDARRLWFCCPLRTLKRSAASRQRKQVQHGASTPPRSAGPCVEKALSSHGVGSGSSVPAPPSIMGNKSDIASQHTLGVDSPLDTAGWGNGSLLGWCSEEDIEMGDLSSTEERSARLPSNLSANKDGRLFGTSITRTMSPPPDLASAPSPSFSSPSSMSTSSPAGQRASLPPPPRAEEASGGPLGPLATRPD